MPDSEATDPDGGEEAVGGDASDLGETAALGDETGGEAADLGDASRRGEDAGFAGVAACGVESAIVNHVLEFRSQGILSNCPKSERAGWE